MRMAIKFSGQILRVFMSIAVLCSACLMAYAQESMEDAIVTVTFSENDNTKTIVAKATDQSGILIEDLEIYFYVERTFSLLPIGDNFNFTDEEGIIEVEFPNDLPGDTEGNVNVVIKIMDSDTYNDLTLKRTIDWGLPIVLEDSEDEKRSLWAAAANAPLTLIILISSLIFAVWYVIFYIIYVLLKISKIKPELN